MGLNEYRRKRDFAKTPEPSGRSRKSASTAKTPAESVAQPAAAPSGPALRFVVQKHRASHLHYDFRLEMEGVLKSWAVPKGPSLDPSQKRLAVRTEDHPLEYADFEGNIPEGEYGGGTVMVWDAGRLELETDPAAAARQVEDRQALTFTLHGTKLKGRWRLVPFAARGETPRNWLLIKSRDEAARDEGDVLADLPDSVKTGRSLEQIAESGEVWSDEGTAYGD
jgi:bifunctional non-homologous end joining protein LigD